MIIQIDSREHKKELERIQQQFDGLGVQYFRSKLYCGDYQSLDNAKLCIDRKKDLQELCGNVCQQHERFKAELIRAREAGIQLIILCEHGPDIKSFGDVYFWENPRKHKIIWKTVNGKRVDIPSYLVKVGDVIAVAENSKDNGRFKLVKEEGAYANAPKWLESNAAELSAKVVAVPDRDDIDYPVEERLIVEFYSK